MAKKAAGKSRADLPVNQDVQQCVPAIVALTVKEILDEHIAKKLA